MLFGAMLGAGQEAQAAAEDGTMIVLALILGGVGCALAMLTRPSIRAEWVRMYEVNRFVLVETPLRFVTGRQRPDYRRIKQLEIELGLREPDKPFISSAGPSIVTVYHEPPILAAIRASGISFADITTRPRGTASGNDRCGRRGHGPG
jgi:hypothetical protein